MALEFGVNGPADPFDNIGSDVPKPPEALKQLYGDLFGSSGKEGANTGVSAEGEKAAADAKRSLISSQEDAIRRAQEALAEVSDRFGSLRDTSNRKLEEIFSEVGGDFGVDPAAIPAADGMENPLAKKTETGSKEPPAAAEADTPAPGEEEPPEPETDPMEELDALIGLDTIKHDVRELVDFVKVQKLRQDQGMKSVPVSLHLVFSGNPGTGKTTVARILARVYRQIGVLSKGQLVEVDRSGLVAGYVGQTALKTQEKIQQALGGVLFIDEAYALAKEGNDFGQEAIDTILKAMEDHRDDLVVIVAGYTEPMETFIESNPGLKSRFNKFIEFPDYTIDELMGIFDLNCNKYQYSLSEETREQVRSLVMLRKAKHLADFANAREVRNLFEEIVTNQARRIVQLSDPSLEEISLILPEDLVDVPGSPAETDVS